MERFFFKCIFPFRVIVQNLFFVIFRSILLWALPSDLYFTFSFFFQFFLSLSPWPYYLPNIVNEYVILWSVRDKYFQNLFGGFVIRGRLISWIHVKDFSNQSLLLSDVFLLQSYFSSVGSQSWFCIINGFRTGGPKVGVVLLFIIL